MGNDNAQSLTRLQQETQRGLYDAVLHIGDFAYDMDSVRSHICLESLEKLSISTEGTSYYLCILSGNALKRGHTLEKLLPPIGHQYAPILPF